MVMDLVYGSVQKILRDNLDLRWHCSTWVAHSLTTKQIAIHIEICQEWLECFAYDPNFFNNVITCDETWMYHFEPLSK